MPISGNIIDINNEIEDNPELVNTDAFNNGWIVKIKLSNESELSNLLSNSDYKELID